MARHIGADRVAQLPATSCNSGISGFRSAKQNAKTFCPSLEVIDSQSLNEMRSRFPKPSVAGSNPTRRIAARRASRSRTAASTLNALREEIAGAGESSGYRQAEVRRKISLPPSKALTKLAALPHPLNGWTANFPDDNSTRPSLLPQ